MNNSYEKDIKDILSVKLDGVILSDESKRRIKYNMTEILARRRLPLPERLVTGLRGFWHSTYEVSVAPAALSAAVAVLLLIFTLYPGAKLYTKPIKRETVYIQSIIEQNGTQSVVYLPVDMEVNDNANN